MRIIHISGTFPTNKACKYHCSPNCHPAQIDEHEWKYGCTHTVWPDNRNGNFVPIVECGGNPEKCPLKDSVYKDMIMDYLLGCNGKTFSSIPDLIKAEREINDLNEILK